MERSVVSRFGGSVSSEGWVSSTIGLVLVLGVAASRTCLKSGFAALTSFSSDASSKLSLMTLRFLGISSSLTMFLASFGGFVSFVTGVLGGWE